MNKVKRKPSVQHLGADGRLTMDAPEFGKLFGFNRVLVYKLIKSGAIPSIRFEGSRRVVIPIAWVERMLSDPAALREMTAAAAR